MADLGNPAAKHREGENDYRAVDDAGDDNIAWDIDTTQSPRVLVDVRHVHSVASCRKLRTIRRH